MNVERDKLAMMNPRTTSGDRLHATKGWRGALFGATLALLGALSAGCGGPSVDDVCNKWDSRDCAGWDGKSACKAAGDRLETQASAAGCDTEFQDYLKCVEEANNCSWAATCAEPLKRLQTCVGGPI